MSPHILLSVDSVAFDSKNDIMYVSARQRFTIFVFAWLGYKADVALTAKLNLKSKDDESGMKRYYISHQEDLYQSTEFMKFAWFLWMPVWLFQIWAAIFCVLLSWLGTPMTWWEERYQVQDLHNVARGEGLELELLKTERNGADGTDGEKSWAEVVKEGT